ncbi:hypothetical protein PV328_009121 [Microctonus aethiopoides]|uniref:Protein FAM89A n=1 Tax=Microctonus aethiopoides TaxID=144406 RepID=A0AA39FL05_9HYME|nr:hypothetical protein PV328_009121 [Microctonus aethiopoides]
MKLATMQRSHAPPVPPRPSRQVVAEALKRTAILPYPTRQAPPPPDTQPWRPNHPSSIQIKGRTVIYESAKDDKQVYGCDSNNDEFTKPVEIKTQQEYLDTSERTTSATLVESRREKQQQIEAQFKGETHRENIKSFCAPPFVNVEDTVISLAENRKGIVLNECTSPTMRIHDTTNIQVEESDITKDKLRIKDYFFLQQKIKSEIMEKNLINNNPLKLTTKIKSNDFMTKCENIFKAATGKLSLSEVNSSAVSAITNIDCAAAVVVEKSEPTVANNSNSKDNIQHEDWLEAGIRYSSTKITLPGDDLMTADEEQYHDQNERKSRSHLDFSSICQRIAMSSLQGLPPLPRSLSGFNLNETRGEPPPPPARSSSKVTKSGKLIQQPSTSRPSLSGRQITTLDTQLTILRKEMFGLRQLDLSLLSQLWSLNESIQEFRQLLQDQEDRAPSPSPSSEEGDDVSYANHPPAPPRRPSSLLHQHHHHHHHHHHHRPPRPLRPLPSDESHSSEEYGTG